MECIRHALSVVKKSRRKPSFMAIRITGTPGVGKSCFLPYVKDELLKDGERVFVSVKDSYVYFEGKEVVENADQNMLDTYSDGKEPIIYLCDPLLVKVKPTLAISILFVSPDKGKYKGFSSDLLINIFMPPWHESEIVQCCTTCYNMKEQEIEELYNKWGGSIRRITCPPLFQKTYEEKLAKFLGSENLLDKLNLVENTHLSYDDGSKNDQWILHRWPKLEEKKVDYFSCVFDFPSQYIKTKIREALSKYSIDWKVSAGPQLLGKLYENEVLVGLFERISDPSVEYLKAQAIACDKKKTLVNIPVIRQYIIYSNQSIIGEAVGGALYVPIEPNKTAVDFVFPPWIFQATIRKSHDCKSLKETFDQFPKVRDWNFCVVIPSCAEEKFKYPSIAENVKKYMLIYDADTLS
jgi:hypothetical protein